jgi:predicted transposase/invertase (TIGR01784 family)
MATAYESDITDLVKPYMEKARKEGELKGELKSKLETARKMMEFGDTLEKIILITGLSEAQLKKNGLL